MSSTEEPASQSLLFQARLPALEGQARDEGLGLESITL